MLTHYMHSGRSYLNRFVILYNLELKKERVIKGGESLENMVTFTN